MQPVVGIPRSEFYVTVEVRHEKRGVLTRVTVGIDGEQPWRGNVRSFKSFEDARFTPYIRRSFEGQTMYPTTKHATVVATSRVNDRDGVHG
jgi:hypothetical protein